MIDIERVREAVAFNLTSFIDEGLALQLAKMLRPATIRAAARPVGRQGRAIYIVWHRSQPGARFSMSVLRARVVDEMETFYADDLAVLIHGGIAIELSFVAGDIADGGESLDMLKEDRKR